MSIDIDFWSNGADPFDIPWGSYVFHIHAGAKPSATTTPPTGTILTVPPRSNMPPPLMLQASEERRQISNWFPTIDLGEDGSVTLRLDTLSDIEGFDLQAVFDGLDNFSDRIDKVDVVGWAANQDA